MNDYDDILIHPCKGRKEQNIPETGIIAVNPSEAASWQAELLESGGRSQFIFHSKLVIASNNAFFVAGPAIGAPMATMVMEKLIVLGAKRIILFGWCGAISTKLSVGDIILPKSCESGEGTSQYYGGAKSQLVNADLLKELSASFGRSGLDFSHHTVWSTDAIYRESKRHLAKLHISKDVGAVDMEFSALCAVGAFRAIQFASVLVVSDELWGESWRPGFKSETFLSNKEKAIQALSHMFIK